MASPNINGGYDGDGDVYENLKERTKGLKRSEMEKAMGLSVQSILGKMESIRAEKNEGRQVITQFMAQRK